MLSDKALSHILPTKPYKALVINNGKVSYQTNFTCKHLSKYEQYTSKYYNGVYLWLYV